MPLAMALIASTPIPPAWWAAGSQISDALSMLAQAANNPDLITQIGELDKLGAVKETLLQTLPTRLTPLQANWRGLTVPLIAKLAKSEAWLTPWCPRA